MIMINLPIRIVALLLLVGGIARPLSAQSSPPIREYGRGIPRDVLWSPQGDQVLVVTQTNSLWRYDAHSLDTIDSFSGIMAAAYSSSGAWLFTKDADDRWAIRHADTLEQMITSDFEWVSSIAGTDWLLTRDDTGTAFRRERDPQEIVLEGLASVYWSADRRFVLTQDRAHGIILRDSMLTPLDDQPAFPDDALAAHWSPDGRRIAVVTSTERVEIITLSPNMLRLTFNRTDRERFSILQWSPDSTRLLDYDNVGNARIWEVDTGRLSVDLPSGSPYFTEEERATRSLLSFDYWDLSWSTDGSHLFRCLSDGGDIYLICRVYDAFTGEETGQAFGDSWYALNFSPDRRFFVLSEGIFDANTGAVVDDLSEGRLGGFSRAFSADSRRVAMASAWSSDIAIYNFEDMQVEHALAPAPYLYDDFSMKWSPDDEQLVTWGSSYGGSYAQGSGLITFWDANTGLETGRITEHILFGQEMGFSSDSLHLAATDSLGNIAVFEAATGNLVHLLDGHNERVSMLAWQPDGDLLATTTGRLYNLGNPPSPPIDGTLVQVWDTHTGTLIATLNHTHSLLNLLWDPSGAYVITDDSTGMSIWDIETSTRRQLPEMSGGAIAPEYRLTDEGNVLIRAHYSCSHYGGSALNFFNLTTQHHVGPIDCSGQYHYTWNDEIGGIAIPRLDCSDHTAETGSANCQIDALILSTEGENDLYNMTPHDVAPAYSFSHFEVEPQVFQSPATPLVALVSDTKMQMWRMGIKAATLLWTGETASEVVWDHAGQLLALVTANDVRVVNAQTGSIRASLQDLQPTVVRSIEWSPDNAYLRVSTLEQGYIFDAVSGTRVPLPNDVRPVRWMNGFLEVHHPALDRTEWWTIKPLRSVAVGDQIPSIVSADRRFGAETRTGVLRLWHLAE